MLGELLDTLRLGVGGSQSFFGVSADLSRFGKMLGGGFPLGAFGGRADVLAAFDPTVEGGPAMAHPGSMNAWSVGLAAAEATLRHLTPERIALLDEQGAEIRSRLQEVGTSVACR